MNIHIGIKISIQHLLQIVTDNSSTDQTPNSGIGRIRRYLSPADADKYLNGSYRSRIINVWRPINRPAQDCPLTFCAANTVAESDLVPVDRYNPEFVLELHYLKYAEHQKWWWVKEQRPEEIAVFCQFDSEGRDKCECSVLVRRVCFR